MQQGLSGHHKLAERLEQLGEADTDHHEQIALLTRFAAEGIEHQRREDGADRCRPPGPAAHSQVEGEYNDGQRGAVVDPHHIGCGQPIAHQSLHQTAGEPHGGPRHHHPKDARQPDLEQGELFKPCPLPQQGVDHPGQAKLAAANAQGQQSQRQQRHGQQSQPAPAWQMDQQRAVADPQAEHIGRCTHQPLT